MLRSVGFVALSAFTLAACRTPEERGAEAKDVTADVQGYPTPIVCASGEAPLRFQLDGSAAVKRADIGLKGNLKLMGQSAQNDASGYRIDLCVNDSGEVELQRMVQRVPATSAFNTYYNEYKPDSKAPAGAWEEAITDGGSALLEVRFKNQTMPKASILLKGWKGADGAKFLTVSTFDWAGDALAASPLDVKYGRLNEGDPWIASFVNHDRLVIEGAIRLEMRYDVKDGANNYKTYRIRSIRVVDKNPALPTTFDQTVSSEADIAAFVKVNQTHHSLLDSFVFQFKHADYKIGEGGLHVTYKAPLTLPANKVKLECSEVSKCGSALDGDGKTKY